MLYLAAREPQRLLDRFEHLRRAGMEQKAVEILQPQAVLIEKCQYGRTQLLRQYLWDVLAQHQSKAVVLDLVSGQAFGVAPEPLPGRPQTAHRFPFGARRMAKDEAGRAVAEDRAPDQLGYARIRCGKAQALEFDDQAENIRGRYALGDARRARHGAEARAAA